MLFTYGALGLFSSYDESIINILYRSQYIGSALLIILGVWYVRTALDRQRIAQYVTTAIVLLGLAASSGFIWHTQPLYSDIMTQDMVRAADHIPEEYTGAVLVNTFPTGMWLAAIKGRETMWMFQASPPEMYVEQYAMSQCVVAWRDECSPKNAAATLGVRYVLVNTRPPFGREPNFWGAPPKDSLWEPTEAASWLSLVASYGTVRLWEVRT